MLQNRGTNASLSYLNSYRSLGEVDENCTRTLANALSLSFDVVDLYHFPSMEKYPPRDQVSAVISALQQAKVPLHRLGTYWLDIETFEWSPNTTANVAFILEMAHAVTTAGMRVGVYSGARSWKSITNDTTAVSALTSLLWYAHYDGKSDDGDFSPFGGWTAPVRKQFMGTQKDFCGIRQVDLDWSHSI